VPGEKKKKSKKKKPPDFSIFDFSCVAKNKVKG
jgi:hypothetical protein